jgi:hypothetical protein
MILHNIQELLSRDWQVELVHTIREGNACVDYLAKIGASSLEAIQSFTAHPAGINNLLLADDGIFFPK